MQRGENLREQEGKEEESKFSGQTKINVCCWTDKNVNIAYWIGV